ncbi:MAG TPA: ABC transporter permease [Actinokineospora sp.]|nr:ABC transporter permease [Actinokineospora sp.]
MSERLWRLNTAHRMGWISFFKEYPPKILALTAIPRVLLQSAFFVLLAGVVGGFAAEKFALIGVMGTTMTIFTVTSICDVPILEAQSATFYRHRVGIVSPFAALMCRGVPHAVAGMCAATLILSAVAPATGHSGLVTDLLAYFPIYLLMAVTCTIGGLTIGVLSSPSDNQVLASNLYGYLILILSGAVIPVERLGVFGDLGMVLPMHHGVAAVRAALAQQPWAMAVLMEVAVGALWITLAWASVAYRVRLARVRGAADHS